MNAQTVVLDASALEIAFRDFENAALALAKRLSPELIGQILKLATDVFEHAPHLRYVHVDDGSACAGDLRICIQPSKRMLAFLAAICALDRDLDGVFETHGSILTCGGET